MDTNAQALEIIPNDTVANGLLDKIEVIRTLGLARDCGVTIPQLRVNSSDTYYSIARKVMKSYIRQQFPSSDNPQILTRYIKVKLIPSQKRIAGALWGYQSSQRTEQEALRFIEPVRVALDALIDSVRIHRNNIQIQSAGDEMFVYVKACSDDFIQVRGRLKEHLLGLTLSVRSFKDAMNRATEVIGDYEATLEQGRALKRAHDEAEERRRANIVADVCTRITGIGYGVFATQEAATAANENVIVEEVRPGVFHRVQFVDENPLGGHPDPIGHLGDRGTPFDDDNMQRVEDDDDNEEHDEDNGDDGVIEITIPVEAPRARRRAEPELQERLNQILREQGVVV